MSGFWKSMDYSRAGRRRAATLKVALGACGKIAHSRTPACSIYSKTSIPSSSPRSEEHTSELQSQSNLVCRLLLEKKKKKKKNIIQNNIKRRYKYDIVTGT